LKLATATTRARELVETQPDFGRKLHNPLTLVVIGFKDSFETETN
jgi:hypothetical protein